MRTVRIDEVAPQVRLVTLDRPERLNAMSVELVDDLHDTFDQLAADRDCRVVVLTGEGRGFCAGLDLKDLGERSNAEDQVGSVGGGMRRQQRIASLVPKMRAMPQPIIAAVNGPASGGGLALALAADVRVASRSARFNVAFVRIGLSGCDIGVSWLLPRLIGVSRAFELLLTGRIVEADEADRLGLLSRLVDDGEVVDAAVEIAIQITANSPFGVWMTKEVMWSNLEVPGLQAAIDLENRTQVLAAQSEDMAEAVLAFLQKRRASFGER